MRSCEHCIHHALDEGGVWCKEFGESIHDPVKVAADCGVFDPIEPIRVVSFVDKGAAHTQRVLYSVQPPHLSDEQYRTVDLHVHVPYFGKEHHAEQIKDNIERQLGLMFSKGIKVERDG